MPSPQRRPHALTSSCPDYLSQLTALAVHGLNEYVSNPGKSELGFARYVTETVKPANESEVRDDWLELAATTLRGPWRQPEDSLREWNEQLHQVKEPSLSRAFAVTLKYDDRELELHKALVLFSKACEHPESPAIRALGVVGYRHLHQHRSVAKLSEVLLAHAKQVESAEALERLMDPGEVGAELSFFEDGLEVGAQFLAHS